MSRGDYFVVRRGATALRNEVVWDSSISYAALGVLARALATPQGADLGYRAFVGRGLGEKAVRAALRELEAAGYRHRVTVRRAGGLLRTLTVFSDTVMTYDQVVAELPDDERATVVTPHTTTERSTTPTDDEAGRQDGPPAPAPRPRRSHRAAAGAARCDQHEHGQDQGPEDQPSASSHRAAAGAARSDLRKHGVSAGRTVQRSTAARSTVARSTAARSTVPRSSTALSLRDTNTSQREVLPDQTGPARGRADDGPPSPAGGGSGQAGPDEGQQPPDPEPPAESPAPPPPPAGGPAAPGTTAAQDPAGPAGDPPQDPPPGTADGPAGDRPAARTTPQRPSQAPRTAEQDPGAPEEGPGRERPSESLSEPQEVRDLISGCLPDHLRALDAHGARQVAALLRQRLDAGWRPADIRRLMDQELPPVVHRLSALVAARLRANVDPALAPARDATTSPHAARQAETRRQEATRRRSEELAGTTRTRDPAHDAAWDQARSEMPSGTPHLQLALRVSEILAADSVDRVRQRATTKRRRRSRRPT